MCARRRRDATLADAFERVEAARSDIPLTYFEYATARPGIIRRREDQAAILEVAWAAARRGEHRGRRLRDRRSVDLDHQSYLGNDGSRSVSRRRAFFAPAAPGSSATATRRARSSSTQARSAPRCSAGADFRYEANDRQWDFIGARSSKRALPFPRCGTLAAQERLGALAALTTLRAPAGVPGEIKRGLTLVRLPAACRPSRQARRGPGRRPQSPCGPGARDGLGDMGFYENRSRYSRCSATRISRVVDAMRSRVDRWMVATPESDRAAPRRERRSPRDRGLAEPPNLHERELGLDAAVERRVRMIES